VPPNKIFKRDLNFRLVRHQLSRVTDSFLTASG
jgi:hypothetical protein